MTATSSNDWKEQFQAALVTESAASMIAAMQTQATGHAGTASAKVKGDARKMLEKHYAGDSEALYDIAMSFCRSHIETAEEIGAVLLPAVFARDPDAVIDELHRLADSPHWEVREWVASACGQVLVEHFDAFYPSLIAWSGDASENVRRAAVLAAMYAGKTRDAAFAEPLLNLLEMHLSDPSPYIRKNLGPFAIGDALLRYYPEQVLARLHNWVQSDDEQTRWNVAMAFTAAASRPHASGAKPILDILALDERPLVRRAVAKARNNLDSGHTAD